MNQQTALRSLSGQKIYPQAPRRRGLRALLLIIGLLVLLGGASYLSTSVLSKTFVFPQQSLPVSGTPTLVINGPVGNVKIHSGSSNSVVINATEHGDLFSNLSTNDVTVAPAPESNDIVVQTEDGSSMFDHKHIDLDIALPSTSNIRVIIPIGSLDINGISGQMNLQMYVGALHFENGTIEGQSTFKNETGEITFDGAIASHGTYNFEDNTGTINLTLPSNSSFALNASVNPGKLNNDFGSNTVGPQPSSQVYVHTNTGNVNIHKK